MLNFPLVYVVVKNKNKNAKIVPNACSFLLSVEERAASSVVWGNWLGDNVFQPSRSKSKKASPSPFHLILRILIDSYSDALPKMWLSPATSDQRADVERCSPNNS
jgi:hypothetical protein